MKKILLIIGIFAILYFIIGCNDDKDPKTNAQQFIEAYNKLDLKKAEKYSSENTKEFLIFYQKFITSEMKKAAKNSKVQFLSIKITSDSTASADFKIKNKVKLKGINGNFEIISEEIQSINMIRRHGKWIAEIKK